MKYIDKHNVAISTILAFALLPLSGFATDMYLPSFPTMANIFNTSEESIQLTLVVFVVTSGIGQLFAGTFVDRFGRYRLGLVSLLIFALSSFAIALSRSIELVIVMRVIQGLAVAVIVVSKRAFFMDVHSGDKLKHYTSLFSIIWATAPIVAPFLGALLHEYFAWRSNFYFLGAATLILLLLELRFSGETIKMFHALNYKSLLKAYSTKLSNADFAMALAVIGLCFSNVITYNLASPFIIERIFQQSAVTTGNSSLLSGLAILAGGLISKATIRRRITDKLLIAGPFLIILPLVMLATMNYSPSMTSMIMIVLPLHIASGFTFNTFYTYAFTRFSTHAGIVSGLIGGSTFLITSAVTYSLSAVMTIETPIMLAFAYLAIQILLIAAITVFVLVRQNGALFTGSDSVVNTPFNEVSSDTRDVPVGMLRDEPITK